MYPPAPRESTSSNAERRVFRLLADTELDDTFALHSLTLTRHEHKMIAEADFVVVGPRGVLVLEVKGGGVACTDGIWTYEDRDGVRHRSSEGPFEQARGAMFALRDRLTERDPQATNKVLFGFAVVTPDCPLNVDSLEWDDETLIDLPRITSRTELASPLKKIWSYWEQRQPRTRRMTDEQLTAVRQLLRPDFEKLPPLGATSRDLSGAMHRLTENQFNVLDLIEQHDRVLVTGGAGTGKTFIAVEAARREAAAGRRPALVVESPILAAYLRPRVPEGVAVLSLDDLDGHAGPAYDVLLVDEGQDLMSMDTLDRLDRLVDGQLLGSRWRIFYDANNQSGVRGSFSQEALDLLQGAASGPPLTLSRNCRNTTEIVKHTQLTTGADLGVAIAGAGPPVEYEQVDDEAEAAALQRHLERLIDEEYVKPGAITILTDDGLDGCLRHLPRRWRKRLTVVDEDVAAEWPPTAVSVSSAADFKGLENDFVALVDLPNRSLGERRTSLYVGMSRARAGLWVAVPPGAWEELEQMQQANVNAVMGAS